MNAHYDDFLVVGSHPTALPADFDRDGDVDLEDYEILAACLTGPGGQVTPECLACDLDGDADADLIDFGKFEVDFEG